MSRLFWLNDEQWSKIELLLPHYGSPPRVDGDVLDHFQSADPHVGRIAPTMCSGRPPDELNSSNDG